MAGVKMKSGRKPKGGWDKFSIDELLKHSIRLTNLYMRDESVPLKDRAEMAVKFAVKALPDKVIVDEVKKLSFDERMLLIDEFKKLVNIREERLGRQDEVTTTGE